MYQKLLLPLCLTLTLSACGTLSTPSTPTSPAEPKTAQLFAMDTVMDLSVYTRDDSLMEQASELVSQLEHDLSTTDQNSEIYTANTTGSASLSDSTAQLLERALGFCDKTGGALDLSIYPVVRAWGFTTDTYQVPEQSELDALLEHVDYTNIIFSPTDQTVTLPEGMEIDLGSVAKGYTSDRLIQLFRENDVTSALLNLGGNVHTLGSKPDGSPWRIGIQDPQGDSYLGVLSTSDQAVITSGGYERFFKGEDGTIYWHIIDPKTGYPAKNGLISATVIGPEGVYCDALSTALFIMGPEKAADFWREHQDFETILVTDQNEVLITPGLVDSFQLMEGSPYKLSMIPAP